MGFFGVCPGCVATFVTPTTIVGSLVKYYYYAGAKSEGFRNQDSGARTSLESLVEAGSRMPEDPIPESLLVGTSSGQLGS